VPGCESLMSRSATTHADQATRAPRLAQELIPAYGVTLLQARFAAWSPAAEDLGAGILR
jgi:hypothetical protein